MAEPLDASRLLDERGITSFNIKLAIVGICLLKGWPSSRRSLAA